MWNPRKEPGHKLDLDDSLVSFFSLLNMALLEVLDFLSHKMVRFPGFSNTFCMLTYGVPRASLGPHSPVQEVDEPLPRQCPRGRALLATAVDRTGTWSWLYSEFSLEKWGFSIVIVSYSYVNVYQRVIVSSDVQLRARDSK